MKRDDVLSKHAVDMYFLMKYCLLGAVGVEFDYKNKYIDLSKEYFDMLSKDNISEEEFSSFSIKKLEVLDSVLQIRHEFSEDDEKLVLERKLLAWEFNHIQNKNPENKPERNSPINTVSEEEFFNE